VPGLSIVENIANKAIILLDMKHELLRDYCSFVPVSKEKNIVFSNYFLRWSIQKT